VAKIIPFSEDKSGTRQFGRMRGKITIDDDFDAPLPEDILNAFYAERCMTACCNNICPN